MPAKKTKKAGPKPRAKKAPARTARSGRGQAVECDICGYRLIVDEECGCADEHVLLCCGQPMSRR